MSNWLKRGFMVLGAAMLAACGGVADEMPMPEDLGEYQGTVCLPEDVDCVEAPRCGDGLCNGYETTASCSRDCGTLCGDGSCNGGETTGSCSADCGYCGDGSCRGGETASSCGADCSYCGDGRCTGSETRYSCAKDCYYPLCGDNYCDTWGGEGSGNCSRDCPMFCGNYSCEPNWGESRYNCPFDCIY